MGCYRVYAHGRSADLHKVMYELETATQTMKVEPEQGGGGQMAERPRGYMHNIRSVFRLASDHECPGVDPWAEHFNPIDELYIDKDESRG